MTWMKKAAGLLGMGLAALAFGQAAGAPQETFRLSYGERDWSRLVIAQNAVYREENKVPASGQTPAKETRQSQDIGFEVELRRLSKNADGSMDIEVTYRRKWRTTLREGEAAAAVDYSLIPGKKMTFRMFPDGNIVEIKGFESFPKIIDPATGQPIENSDFGYDIGHLFPRLPDKPVSVGSTWDAPESPDAIKRPGSEPPVFHYQIVGRVNKAGEDCLKIVASRVGKRSAERPASDGQTQQVNSEYGRVDVSYYSLNKGMFVAKSISFQNKSMTRLETRPIGESALLALYECAVAID